MGEVRYPCPRCGEVALVTCRVVVPEDEGDSYFYSDCLACRAIGPPGSTGAESIGRMMDSASPRLAWIEWASGRAYHVNAGEYFLTVNIAKVTSKPGEPLGGEWFWCVRHHNRQVPGGSGDRPGMDFAMIAAEQAMRKHRGDSMLEAREARYRGDRD